MAKKENPTTPAANGGKYNQRRWSVPSKRAKGYAADRKAKVHTYGKKEGAELTDFEAGIRSGYLQCQAITPVCTSTRRRSPRASPNRKPLGSRVKSPRSEKGGVTDGKQDLC